MTFMLRFVHVGVVGIVVELPVTIIVAVGSQ
jgi:hypothetical protein